METFDIDRTQTFILAYKVINTSELPGFRASLRGLWENTANCHVRFTIQEKQCRELATKLDRFHRHQVRPVRAVV